MYDIKFDPQHLQYIGELLGNSPFKVAAPIIATIQAQVNEQDRIAAEGKAAEGGTAPKPKPKK